MAKKKKETPPRCSRWAVWEAWICQRERYIILGLLAVYLLFSILLFDPKPFVGGDNAAYVHLSRALASGRGLVELWTPEQRPHTQYPFGFPLLLAPISLLGLPYVWYKIVPWLAGLAGIVFAWLFFRKRNAVAALAMALLTAVNVHYLEYGHWVLSELPFLAGLMLTLLLLQRWEDTQKWPWFLGMVLATACCIHLRSAGQALLAAIFLYLLFKRKYRWAAIFLVSGIVLVMPWSWRNRHFGMAGGYLDQFLMRDPYQPELGRAALSEMALRIWINLKLYLGTIWPQMMAPGSVTSGPSPLGWLLFTVISLPVLIGAAAVIRQGRAEGWLALCYLGLCLLWPEAWTDLRFSLPLLPIDLWLMFQGYRLLSGRVFKAHKAAAAVIFLCLSALSLVSIGTRAEANLGMLAEYLRGDKLSGYDPQWRSFFQAAAWMRDNSARESIVVSRKPPLFSLISGRRSYCYPFTTNTDSMIKSLERADYVMVEPVSGTGQRYLIPAIQPLVDKRFRVIQVTGNPATYVLKVIKEEVHVP